MNEQTRLIGFIEDRAYDIEASLNLFSLLKDMLLDHGDLPIPKIESALDAYEHSLRYVVQEMRLEVQKGGSTHGD